MKKDEAILQKWQTRLQKARQEYQHALDKMDESEALYRGTHKIDRTRGSTSKNNPKEATTVRNVVAEIIEAEVTSDIPTPKVTPQHQEDEQLA